MTEARASGRYRERNSTADRTLTILELFTDNRLTISASEVATNLSVARSTAYRYLQSLVSSQFLEEAPVGGFRLGLRVLQLAKLARRGFGLSDAALPLMKALNQQFGETIVLTRRMGVDIVCIEREIPPGQLVRISYERGSRLPINAGASALVLLAWLKDDEVRSLVGREPLQSYTENTLTSADEILARLRQIRQDGYCVTHAHVDPDTVGLAVPVFNGKGAVEASLSVVTFERRVDPAREHEITTSLLDVARQLSVHLELAES